MDSPLRRLKIIYGLALALVALCMLSASWLMQRSITSNSDESRVINLSGRQRMLSQRLTKAVLALPYSASPEARQSRIQEIEESFRAWNKVAQGLQHGDAELALPNRTLSPEVSSLFAEIAPHQAAMVSAISELLSALKQSRGAQAPSIVTAISVLLEHEPAFLRGMDAITFQFDKEARAKMLSLQETERFFLVLGLLILILEFWFIFRPSLARIQALVSEVEDAHEEQRIINKTLEGMLDDTMELARKANAATEAKATFLRTMSHELRTPLNGIMGMNELVLMTKLDDEQKECATAVKECANELHRIIQDILDFSSLEQGQQDCDAVDFALRSSLLALTEGVADEAASKGIGLVTIVEPTVPDILTGDYEKLQQVIEQLVSNAVKYTQQGQVVLGVSVAFETTETVTLRFSIADTGIGMSSEQLEHLFDPFTQGDGSMTRRFGGTGLGLSITKKLVEMMGGRLLVDSGLGRGSTFRFELALTKPQY